MIISTWMRNSKVCQGHGGLGGFERGDVWIGGRLKVRCEVVVGRRLVSQIEANGPSH